MLASFPGCLLTKISKLANLKNFDTVGKSIKNVTKNAEKPMPKNVPVQSYEALKLPSFPGCPVTKISQLTNIKNFDTVGKSIKNVTKNAEKPMPTMYLPNILRR